MIKDIYDLFENLISSTEDIEKFLLVFLDNINAPLSRDEIAFFTHKISDAFSIQFIMKILKEIIPNRSK